MDKDEIMVSTLGEDKAEFANRRRKFLRQSKRDILETSLELGLETNLGI